MSNWDLVTRLLNFDVLIGDKSRRLHLEDQLSIDLIRLTLFRGALNYWVELFWVNELINLETTAVAGVNCDLHARSNVAGSCNDSFQCNKLSNILGANVAHWNNVLFWEFTWHKNCLVIALQLRRNTGCWVCIRSRTLFSDYSLLSLYLACHL